MCQGNKWLKHSGATKQAEQTLRISLASEHDVRNRGSLVTLVSGSAKELER